jgi:ABC-type transport system substrate-binding protein
LGPTRRPARSLTSGSGRRSTTPSTRSPTATPSPAGSFAPTGKLAATILPTDALGYRGYDLYPTPGYRGDPAKAKALLAQAGHPHGLTLTFVTFGSGQYKANFSEYDNPAVNRLIDRALAEPDRARRAALWGQIDRWIMRDAPTP